MRMHTTSKGASNTMSIVRERNALRYFVHSLLICAALIYGPRPLFGQTADSSDEQAQEAQSVSATSQSSDHASEDQQQPSTQPAICDVTHLGQCLKDIGHDQASIWTSPLRVSPRDAFWLVPFAAGTGVALDYDAQAEQNLGIDKSRIDTSNTISAFGSSYVLLGGAAGLYFLGLGTHNQHLAETGRLGGEAVLDSFLVVEALVLPVATLVTHHSFDPSILHGLSNLNGFVHRECHGLFVGNELGAGMYSDLKKIHADLRWRAKAKYVGADLS